MTSARVIMTTVGTKKKVKLLNNHRIKMFSGDPKTDEGSSLGYCFSWTKEDCDSCQAGPTAVEFCSIYRLVLGLGIGW